MQKSVIVVCASSPCSLAEIASTVRQCLCTHARVNNQYMHVKKRTQNAGMMHSHVHTCTHTHIHTDVCASIHTNKQTWKHAPIHGCTHTTGKHCQQAYRRIYLSSATYTAGAGRLFLYIPPSECGDQSSLGEGGLIPTRNTRSELTAELRQRSVLIDS